MATTVCIIKINGQIKTLIKISLLFAWLKTEESLGGKITQNFVK